MILVLGMGGLLKLPETAYYLYVRPGVVVFFLADQQSYKLEVDSSTPNAVQTVFTWWTEACHAVSETVLVQRFPYVRVY
jgi:hypothetical protein